MKYCKLFLLLFSSLISSRFFAQEPVSIHQRQSKEYEKIAADANEKQWDMINHYISPLRSMATSQCTLKKVVFGWHPYWNGTSYNEYDFSLLSDIAYFSYEVNPSTGSYSNIHSWKTTSLVDLAKASGTRVSLTVTLFSGHKTFLENWQSQQTLIDSLISLIKLRGAHGVNIDFEAVPSGQRENLASFMQKLGTRFHTEIPGSAISIALPGVDWNQAFDVNAMLPYVDMFIIMGYDYYYPGSSKAGPVSPKNNGKLWLPYDVTRSVRYYLQTGIPNDKLCLGVPYYGYDWPTVDSVKNTYVTGKGTARLYKDAVVNASTNGRLWDRHASVPFYVYNSSDSWRQCWYDDSSSLGYKYDMVNMYDIAGIGIWALGYDRTRQELWNLLREKFSTCSNTLCSGSFTDMGGPEGNYFPNDTFMFRITGKGAGPLSVSFINFDLSASDTLFAYAGNSNKWLLGKYSGIQNPDIINSDSSSLTFRFVSGTSTTHKGWEAYWHCGMALSPSALTLSASSITENLPKRYFIGKFTVPDTVISGCSVPISDCISYMFCENNDAHAYFTISGDSLLSNTIFDFEKNAAFAVTIKAETSTGQYILNRFDITVRDTNEPPVVAGSVPDQTVRLGEPFSITLPSGLFTDPDTGDIFSINLSEAQTETLPVWLVFDTTTLQLSGIPAGKEGTLKFILTASDTDGARASIPFNLIVEKTAGYVDSLPTDIEVFPNPTSGLLYIVVSSEARVYPYVDMYDYKGSKTGKIRLGVDALNRQKAALDLTSWTEGVYFLVFKTGDTYVTRKVLVVR